MSDSAVNSLGKTRDEDLVLAAVYSELKQVARQRLLRLPPGQTLSATALVHEVWLRIQGGPADNFSTKAHFFAAAGLLMRNILVDRAREKASQKRGGDRQRVDLTTRDLGDAGESPDLVAVHQALSDLEAEDPRAAELVMLRFFAGMTLEEAAAALDISVRTAQRDWTFARAWLHRELSGDS